MRKNVLVFMLIFFGLHMHAQKVSLEAADAFYPSIEAIEKLESEWGYMSVPENWEQPEGNNIKIAYVVMKNWSQNENAKAVVFVQGGPGASGIQNIGSWVYHPLRENNDIVLLDIRGTGFSEPRLCPELGDEFLNILAKNQSNEEDVKQKVVAALSCQRDLINQGIDIASYNSQSVSKDLNGLKEQLNYTTWTVYGVSYGTYMAQVYANTYPEDIENLILDSSIDDITTYYSRNTSNFMGSLQKVFEACKKDPGCNAQYPNLEKRYFESIASLEKDPLTVKVDKDVIESGEFTFNSEDFKVAIQQALYKKKFIEVIPILINQFHNRNKEALGNLVAAFSGLLSMDYGVYYCVSCNETLPNNDLANYELDARQFDSKGLMGGVSFYKSDFDVCNKWNVNRIDSLSIPNELSNLSTLDKPVLIFAGEFDPITPLDNGEKVASKFQNARVININSYGHVPSFTSTGKELAKSFVDQPMAEINTGMVDSMNDLDFAKNIALNAGVSKMGSSINRLDPLFMAPLAIALLLMISFTITYAVKLIRRRYTLTSDKIVRGMSMLMSFAGLTGLIGLVLALLKISGKNYFILAFGLPENFNYLFTVIVVFMVLIGLTMAYFVLRIKKINDRSIVFSLIFSNLLLATYFLYWGIV